MIGGGICSALLAYIIGNDAARYIAVCTLVVAGCIIASDSHRRPYVVCVVCVVAVADTITRRKRLYACCKLAESAV